MLFINRLYVFTKRILSSKLYLALILTIISLTVLYKVIPAKHKAADIRVGICIMDKTYKDELLSSIDKCNSIYTFIIEDNVENLRQKVDAGKYECGFYIPDGFFNDYINGIGGENMVIEYVTARSTLASAISEQIFSQIFKLCATDILYIAFNNPDYNQELTLRIQNYMNSDEVFTIEDFSSNRTISDGVDVPVNIPVYEVSILLIIFAGLLGLILYTKSAEKNYYIALSSGNRLMIKFCGVLSAILPILVVSIICCLITYNGLSFFVGLIISSLGVIIFDFLAGSIIKKSSSLEQLLPIIMLILIPLIIIL